MLMIPKKVLSLAPPRQDRSKIIYSSNLLINLLSSLSVTSVCVFVCCVGVYIVHILYKLRFWHNFIVSPYRFSLDHYNPYSSSLFFNCNDPLSLLLFRPLFIYILIYNMLQLTLGSHAAGCVCSWFASYFTLGTFSFTQLGARYLPAPHHCKGGKETFKG